MRLAKREVNGRAMKTDLGIETLASLDHPSHIPWL